MLITKSNSERSWRLRGAFLLLVALQIPFSGLCAEVALPQRTPDPSLKKDAVHAMNIGAQWLAAQQRENGCWSNPVFPAMTGLAVSAILHSPEFQESPAHPPSVTKGIHFILSCVQKDGGIYQSAPQVPGGSLPVYNTAICMMTLIDANNPAYTETIRKARKFLVDSQHSGEDPFTGGMGYDTVSSRTYADLSNTVFALEALRRSEYVEWVRDSSPRSDLDWKAAIEFVSRCQHLRETNKSKWVSDAPDQRGGFIYNPLKSQAGPVTFSPETSETLRSYGGMTYAGLLSFLYAKVDRNDPRVVSAVDWIRRRWTLDENPGLGTDGLYYYYHTMAKALSAYGAERLELAGGRTAWWRQSLVSKLVSLQRIDPKTGFGYWQNDNNRWWENDANLTTAYAMLALEMACSGLEPASTMVKP